MSSKTSTNLILSLTAGLLGGALGALATALLATPQAAAETEAPAVTIVAAPESDGDDRAEVTARLGDFEGRFRELERRFAGLKNLRKAQTGVTINSAGDLVRSAPSAPVTDREVMRYLELQRAVARFRNVRTRQERARDSVDRILDDAKIASSKRAAIDPIVRSYFDEERAILMTDRNQLDDVGREMLDRTHGDLRKRVQSQLASQLEGPVAAAVADQLAQGGAHGRSYASAKGFRSLKPGELEIPGNIGPFRK